MAAHYGNKRAKSKKLRIQIRHDLTKKRLELLKKARDEVKRVLADEIVPPEEDRTEPNEKGDRIFFYPDINCNLVVRSGRTAYKFDSFDELKDIISVF